jgi:hypothetical protein
MPLAEITGKKAALIAEGMTEGEADYIMSGGMKSEGLTPPGGDASGASKEGDQGASQDAASDAAKQAATTAQQAAPADKGQAAAQPGKEDDGEEGETWVPAKDSLYYPHWKREKQQRQQLQTELRTRDERLTTLSTELEDSRQKWARIDERLKVFREAVEQPPEPDKPKPKPDRETDPFGYMAWLEERVESLAPKLEQVTTQVQERDAATALQSAYVGDARSFSATQSDFPAAYRWLMANRDAELVAAGYVDPQERLRIITLDERDIVARALQGKQQNPNAPGPAQIIYGLAKARGYQMPAAANGAVAGANGANGAAAANVAANGAANGAAAAAGETVTKQVENIQRGQAASRSLSSGGGSPVATGISLEQLHGMSDDEYLAWKISLNPAQRKELRGLLGAQ